MREPAGTIDVGARGRARFHVRASVFGALSFGVLAALPCAVSERTFEAAAPIAIRSNATSSAETDIGAVRALLSTEPILRRAALRPEAAAIIETQARPSSLERVAALFISESSGSDTLTRAVTLLAQRIDARAGPWPGSVDVVARMPSSLAAATIATAVAEAFVADFNETATAARRRGQSTHSERLDRAARRLDEARSRTLALRAADPSPTGAVTVARAELAEPAASVDRLRRQSLEAEARYADAKRLYGPRHPELIARESDVRRARAAFDAATRTARATRAEPPTGRAEGGPDPRAAELAATEVETAQAQTAYDIELSRNETDRHEARVMKPAPAPATSTGPSAPGIVVTAALAGFLLFGAAPGLRTHARRRKPAVRDRRIATLRAGALTAAGARAALSAIEIDRGLGARTLIVASDGATDASDGANALAMAALAMGWRPLLISKPAFAGSPTDGGALLIGGKRYSMRRTGTRYGALDAAAPDRRGAAATTDAIDAVRAYDLLIFDCGSRTPGAEGSRADCVIRVAAALSDEAAGGMMTRLKLHPDIYAGALVTARELTIRDSA